MASDIPEVVGTAFALRFLFGMPLWIGVIVTSLSVVLFLMVNVFGVRKLELLIGSLIGVVLICFVGELLMSTASLGGILGGLIPTFNLRAMYAATSLIGSVVMPHNIFLHSALVQVSDARVARTHPFVIPSGQTRSVRRTSPAIREACYYNFIESCIALSISLVINVSILASQLAGCIALATSDVPRRSVRVRVLPKSSRWPAERPGSAPTHTQRVYVGNRMPGIMWK